MSPTGSGQPVLAVVTELVVGCHCGHPLIHLRIFLTLGSEVGHGSASVRSCLLKGLGHQCVKCVWLLAIELLTGVVNLKQIGWHSD